jgi:hypothetical protein
VLVAGGSFLLILLLVLLAGLSGVAVVPFLDFAGIGEPGGKGEGQVRMIWGFFDLVRSGVALGILRSFFLGPTY